MSVPPHFRLQHSDEGVLEIRGRFSKHREEYRQLLLGNLHRLKDINELKHRLALTEADSAVRSLGAVDQTKDVQTDRNFIMGSFQFKRSELGLARKASRSQHLAQLVENEKAHLERSRHILEQQKERNRRVMQLINEGQERAKEVLLEDDLNKKKSAELFLISQLNETRMAELAQLEANQVFLKEEVRKAQFLLCEKRDEMRKIKKLIDGERAEYRHVMRRSQEEKMLIHERIRKEQQEVNQLLAEHLSGEATGQKLLKETQALSQQNEFAASHNSKLLRSLHSLKMEESKISRECTIIRNLSNRKERGSIGQKPRGPLLAREDNSQLLKGQLSKLRKASEELKKQLAGLRRPTAQ